MNLVSTKEAAARLGIQPAHLRVLNHRHPELRLQAPRHMWEDGRTPRWDADAIDNHLASEPIEPGEPETVFDRSGLGWSLLDVLAPLGALAIAQREQQPTSLRWVDSETVRAHLTIDPYRLGSLLKTHAKQMSRPTSWLQADCSESRPLFGWHQKPPNEDDRARRGRLIAKLGPVDLALIDGIGMPGDPAPPILSAMPARNSGKVIGLRLRDGAEHVAGLDPDQILDVIINGAVLKPAGDMGMWRTGGADLLLGWLAIWGMSFFPIRWLPSGRPDPAGIADTGGDLHVAVPLSTIARDYASHLDLTTSHLIRQAAAGAKRLHPQLDPAHIAQALWGDVRIVRWPIDISRVGPALRRTAPTAGQLLPTNE